MNSNFLALWSLLARPAVSGQWPLRPLPIKPSEENKSWTSPGEISATLLHPCSQEVGTINGARIPLFGEPL